MTEQHPVSHVVNLRAAPNFDLWRPPVRPPAHALRLGDRVGLVVTAAAARGAMPESFGLGAYLLVTGLSVLGGGILVADELATDSPEARSSIAGWAANNPIATVAGPRPWALRTLSEFFEPYSGVFAARAYTGAGWCIGADLGRILGLAAEHWGARLGRNADAWELWLPGWGREHGHGRWKKRSPHRPPLWLTARRVGWRVEFAPCGKDREGHPAGKRVGGRVWRGAFLDVLSLAYALDADRSASFAEHCSQFGVIADELPIAVHLDTDGAQRVARAARSIHALAIALDK